MATGYEIIKSKNKIEEVAKELGFKGRETSSKIQGPCPKCGSSTGMNFVVNIRDQYYKCFHAGEKGSDVIGMVEHLTGMSHEEAVQWLCDRAKIENPFLKMTPEERALSAQRKMERDYVYNILTYSIDFYHKQLLNPKHKDKLDYLLNHVGYSMELIVKEKIGFCPKEVDYVDDISLLTKWEEVFKVKDPKNITGHMFTLIKSGLFKETSFGGRPFPTSDYFEGRYIYPYWKTGFVRYVCARAIKDYTPANIYEKDGQQTVVDPPKYLKLPKYDEHHATRKFISPYIENDTFMGEDTIKGASEIVITEGAPDCLSAIELGLPVISPVTTKFREDDKSKLEKLTNNKSKIFIINDNELPKNDSSKGAGDLGAYKTADYLTRIGRNVYLVKLPRPEGVEKVDLNSYVADLKNTGKTIEEIRSLIDQLIAESKSYIDILIDEAADIDKIDDRMASIRHTILPVLSEIEPLLRSTYIDEMAKKLRLTKADIKEALKEIETTAKKDAASSSDLIKGKEYRAKFPNLVNLIKDESGKLLYLFKEDGKLVAKDKVSKDPTTDYLPPPQDSFIWKVPNHNKVLEYYATDTDARLFEDLVKHHSSISEIDDPCQRRRQNVLNPAD